MMFTNLILVIVKEMIHIDLSKCFMYFIVFDASHVLLIHFYQFCWMILYADSACELFI